MTTATDPRITRFADVTRIRKGRDGWSATTRAPYRDGYILRFDTSKRACGGISTIVTRMAVKDGFESFVVFGDFNKTVAEQPKARCTEKSITDLHFQALAEHDNIVKQVDDFYVRKIAAFVRSGDHTL